MNLEYEKKDLGCIDKSVVNLIYVTKDDNLDEFIDEYKPEIIFFIGWSWIIKENIIRMGIVIVCQFQNFYRRIAIHFYIDFTSFTFSS